MKKILIGLLFTISLVSYGTSKVQKDFELKLKYLQSGSKKEIDKLYEESWLIDDNSEELKVLLSGYKKITYKINSTKVKRDTAVINLDMKAPNLFYYVPEIIEKSAESELSNSGEFLRDFFEEKLNSKDLVYLEKNINVYLKKEENDWVVDEEEPKNAEFGEMITLGLSKAFSE